jgi:hypothetical protein
MRSIMSSFIFIALVALALPLAAMDGDTSFGYKAGLLLPAGDSLDRGHQPGTAVGFFFDMRRGGFGFQPGLQYSKRLYTFGPNSPSQEWMVEYLEVPLMMRLVIPLGPLQPNLCLGPRFIVPMHVGYDEPNHKGYTDTDQAAIGLSVGTGLDILLGRSKLMLQACYDADDIGARDKTGIFETGRVRLQLGIAYMFWRGDLEKPVKHRFVHSQDLEPVPAAAKPATAEDQAYETLKAYKHMLDEGLISDADYAAKKAQLLGLPEPAEKPGKKHKKAGE